MGRPMPVPSGLVVKKASKIVAHPRRPRMKFDRDFAILRHE